MMIQITVNNETHLIPQQTTLSGLLEHLQLQGKRIAVEMNGNIVPKSQHANTVLTQGSTLEIVVAVGGG
jgi:sulfur carrier protein